MCSKLLRVILLADDRNIFYSDTNIDCCLKILNKELIYLDELFKLNKLSLNLTKNKLHNYHNYLISVLVVLVCLLI